MVCVPTASAVGRDTAPLTSGAWPRSAPVVVSKKSTLPVGRPEPGALTVTVAASVMTCPPSDGLTGELAAVVVAAGLTVKLKVRAVMAGGGPGGRFAASAGAATPLGRRP